MCIFINAQNGGEGEKEAEKEERRGGGREDDDDENKEGEELGKETVKREI